MSSIQSGASWWVDGYARFAGGNIGRAYRSGAMNNTSMIENPDVWGTNDSDSFTSVVSDVEEEGEVEGDHADLHHQADPADEVADAIDAGNSDTQTSPEIVAATAVSIGIIEAAMRQHQSDGTSNFDDSDSAADQDPTTGGFTDSMSNDMFRDPSQAFAASIPGPDRPGLLSLLT